MPATRYLFATLSVLALGAYAETLPLSKLPQGWQGGIEVQCREGFCSGEGAVLLQINGRKHRLPADFFTFSPAPTPATPQPPIRLPWTTSISTAGRTSPCRAGSKAPTALGRMTSTCKPKTETC